MSTDAVLPPQVGRRDALVAAAIFVLATVVVAGVGAVANAGGMDWYDALEKPAFTPPGPTFGIVWTILYALIALAGWLAWRATDRPAPTVAWAVQMALNLGWTATFFGLQAPEGALVVIALLLGAIVVNVVLASRVARLAAWLLVPYALWVCFATALNVGVATLN